MNHRTTRRSHRFPSRHRTLGRWHGAGVVAVRAAAASLLLLVCFAAPVARSEDGLDPTAARVTIERLHRALLEVMQQADALGFEGRYERLEPTLRDAFDFDFMAEKALGRHWRTLASDDQARMRDVFARFTLSTYANRFSGWSGERFETRSADPAPRDTVFVRTVLLRPEGEEDIEINYRLHHSEAGWRVIDVLLRGTVSELALRRSEYSSVIKRDGFEALVASLEEKIAELASGAVEDSPS